MKRSIQYLTFLLIAAFHCAHASQRAAAPVRTNIPQSDCKQIGESWYTKESKTLRVSISSCSEGFRILADRRKGNQYLANESRPFKIAYGGLNEVLAVSKTAFYVNFLQATSYANPSVIIYVFHLRNKKWLLEEMSFQASQSCNGEAGVDADYYHINYRTGKADWKTYTGCNHFKRKKIAVKPASIPLETFDPSDDRLSPFEYN